MKVAVVTGAGGFVGARVAAGLAQSGWRVYALTSRVDDIPQHPAIRAVKCRWTTEGLEAAVARVTDAVGLWVHAAARVELGDEHPLLLYHDNALLTESLAKLSRRVSPRSRFVFLSTVSVYGPGQEPDVAVAPRPHTQYGLSKLLGERLCLAHLGTRCLVLRLAGVWGREQHPELFINRCLHLGERGRPLVITGSGTARRNYVWVGDLPKVILWAHGQRRHGVLLVAGPEPVSTKEMVSMIGAHFGVPVDCHRHQPSQIESDVIVNTEVPLPTTRFHEALRIEARGLG